MNKLILAAPALLATALAFGLSRASPRTHKPSGIYSLLQHSGRAIDVFRAGFSAGGKRVVLENVSARVHAPSGQTVQLYVSTSFGNLPSGSIAARNYVVLTPTNSGTFYFANQQLRMYSIIGANVSIQGQRISYSQGAPVSGTMRSGLPDTCCRKKGASLKARKLPSPWAGAMLRTPAFALKP